MTLNRLRLGSELDFSVSWKNQVGELRVVTGANCQFWGKSVPQSEHGRLGKLEGVTTGLEAMLRDGLTNANELFSRCPGWLSRL
jgi:hypothetical protein